jgi:AraC-like DNA-binding protein
MSVDTFAGSFDTVVSGSALPHARVTVLIELGTGASSVAGVALRTVLVGLQSQPTVFEQRGAVDCVELRLAPSVALGMGIAPSDINDAVEPVDNLFGRTSDSLASQLTETPPAARPDLLREVLRSHVSRQRPTRLAEALEAFERSDAGTGVANAADTLGGSRSALWRHVSTALGVSPQHYLMLRRFEHGTALLAAGVPIAQAATEAGYFDQSHFHRHVKRFAGVTPAQLGRRSDATYVQDGDRDRDA